MITDAEYQALKRAVLLRETRTVEFEGRKVEYAKLRRDGKGDCRPLSVNWRNSRSGHASMASIPDAASDLTARNAGPSPAL